MSPRQITERTSQARLRGAFQQCILPGCNSTYGIHERIYGCPRCNGPLEIQFDFPSPAAARSLRKQWEARAASSGPLDRSGVWRYRELLPFDAGASVITLFEGNTPLYDAPGCAEYSGLSHLRLKHLGCNPTGSFKDTGMTVAVTQAALLGARTVVCASTGNTAASLAAYAARAGLQCAIIVPHGQITTAKLAQSMDYGAAVLEIEGNFDDAMRVVQQLSADSSIYLANSINPFRIEGQKTVAFELLLQCAWRVPDHVVVPGGNMGNSSALAKGFDELLRLGLIERLPKLHVVQAEGAAPLARLFAEMGGAGVPTNSIPDRIAPVEHPQTLATAIKIGVPVSWQKSLRGVLRSGGHVLAVSEHEIADAKAVIGRDGIGCEPASATTVAGIRRLVVSKIIRHKESVVAVLTGHLLKDPDYVSHYHRGTLSLPLAGEGEDGAGQKIHGAFRNPPERVAASKDAILENLDRRRRTSS